MKLFDFVGKKGKRGSRGSKKAGIKRIKRVVTVRTYTVEEKLKILQEYEVAQGTISIDRFCKWWGVSIGTLKEWQLRYKEEGEQGLEPKPKHKPKTEVPDAIKEKIIELKQNDPRAGARRIADYLGRHKFYQISDEAVRQIIKADERTAGLMIPAPNAKGGNKPPALRRFERSRPRQLYQMDIMTWMLKGLYRVYIIACLDDHSRFIVSWGLFRRQSGAHVIDVLRAALEHYDYPEEILTDNGRQFYTWRGKSEFQKYLVKCGIKHIRSRPYHPATLGKIESFWRNIYQELLSREPISSFEEAESKLKEWINYYNFKRPHQGIGGLVPADRFFGVEKPMREAMLEGAGMVKDSLVLDPRVVKEPMYLIGRIGGKELRIIAKEGSVVVEGLEGVEKRAGQQEADDVKYRHEEERHGGGESADKPAERKDECGREAEDSERSLVREAEGEAGLSGGRNKPSNLLQVGESSPGRHEEGTTREEKGAPRERLEQRGGSKTTSTEPESITERAGEKTKEVRPREEAHRD